MNRIVKFAVVPFAALFLMSCAAAHTAISKADLDVQTKMSKSVFLDPMPPEERVVFVQVRNSSDKPAFDISDRVRAAIESKGYTITDNPDYAHILLQANVLQVGKIDPSAAERALLGGYGDMALAGGVGAAAGYQLGGFTSGAGLAGGLIGMAASTIANAAIKDVTYSIITDIQVSERANQGVMVREDTHHTLQQGTTGTSTITASEITDWKRYQTRIVSTANKVNLEFAEAQPELVAGIVRSISGIF